ncbi:uncharacterized protein At5g19025 isoform X2 [Neltuma alba]|uniref:uncharacterized protein At5g19025 isoform X2 n=1 Tax=Neltuma alba TaxID=207710 RepID=UPI0010A4B1AF|nr:uncharacterized protein At5g19025-like isoform X2 [Prosopis alba]
MIFTKNNIPFSNMCQFLVATTTTGSGTVTSAAPTPTTDTSGMAPSSHSVSFSPSSSFLSSSSYPKHKFSNNTQNSNTSSHLSPCKHSPSATLDLLIFVLVLFSGAFLLSSYFSYIFNSLSILLAQSAPQIYQFPRIPYVLGFLAFFVVSALVTQHCCGVYMRKCGKPGCRGLKKAMEFDLQLQSEETLKSGSDEFDKLPWKGGSDDNPDYECLRSELRRMAPPNGRAVLLFRSRCGCPNAKLVGWAPKKGKRQKKYIADWLVLQ